MLGAEEVPFYSLVGVIWALHGGVEHHVPLSTGRVERSSTTRMGTLPQRV